MTKYLRKLFKNEFLIIPSVGILLTILLTWPLLPHITEFFPNKNGTDGISEAWTLWYNQRAFLTGEIFDQNIYFNGLHFYPLPYTLAYSDTLFIPSLFFAPLYWFSHNLSLSTNSVLLLTFIFSFCSSYYVIKKLVKNTYASIIGAFIFTFNPLTFATYQAGQLNILTKCFLPLVFYFGYLYFKKPMWKPAFFFFLFFTLNALSSAYFLVYTILCLPLMLMPVAIDLIRKEKLQYLKRLLLHSSTGLLFVPVLLYFTIPYLQFSHQEGAVRSLAETINYSARPIDFIASPPNNLLYGSLVQLFDLPGNPAHTLSLNIAPFLLAIFGMLYLYRNRKKGGDISFFLGLLFVFCFSLVVMFGPFLQGVSTLSLKLPYYYLYTYLPSHMLDGVRAINRIEFILYIPFSFLAAYGTLALMKRFRIEPITLVTLILLVLCLENVTIAKQSNYVVPTLKQAISPAVHKIVDNKVILVYPNTERSDFLLWGIYFNATLMNGNGHNGYSPYDFMDLVNNVKLTDSKDIIKLKALGIQNIVITRDYATPKVIASNKNLLVWDDNTVDILDLDKLNIPITYCKKSDLQYALQLPQKAYYSRPIDYVMRITNNRDCFLINKYQDRYVQTTITINHSTHIAYLQFPPIIEPHQTTAVWGHLVQYKNQFDYLKLGKINGRIVLPILDIKQHFSIQNLP